MPATSCTRCTSPSTTSPTTWRHASRQRRVIVVSRCGVRAEEAVRHLRTGGVDAVVLEGGLLAWQAAGGEFVATGGGPACLV